MSHLLIAQPILAAHPPRPNTKPVCLAIVWVGNNPASELFIRIKQRQAKRYGIKAKVFRRPETMTTDELVSEVTQLSQAAAVGAIIVQLPLPSHIDSDRVLGAIAPSKDVDNLTGSGVFQSPMVQAVAALQTFYHLDFSGKVVIIGHGRLVGQPIRSWLEQKGYKPRIVNLHAANKDAIIRDADVIIAGSGQLTVTAVNTRRGQIIFDCSGHDVDFDAVKEKAAAITPPKGGIGPLTVHFLLMNVLSLGKNH